MPIQQTSRNRLLRMVLAFALVLMAWHVSQHDLISSAKTNSQEECQVCRLGHTPVTGVSLTALVMPLFVLQHISLDPVVQHHTQSFYYSPGARAPPLA